MNGMTRRSTVSLLSNAIVTSRTAHCQSAAQGPTGPAVHCVEAAEAFGIRDRALEQLVTRELVTQEAHRRGLIVTDEEISQAVQENPSFQEGGRFSFDSYERAVRAQWGSAAKYEALLRQDMLFQNINSAAGPEDIDKLRDNADGDFLCGNGADLKSDGGVDAFQLINGEAPFGKAFKGFQYFPFTADHTDVGCRRTEGAFEEHLIILMAAGDDEKIG